MTEKKWSTVASALSYLTEIQEAHAKFVNEIVMDIVKILMDEDQTNDKPLEANKEILECL